MMRRLILACAIAVPLAAGAAPAQVREQVRDQVRGQAAASTTSIATSTLTAASAPAPVLPPAATPVLPPAAAPAPAAAPLGMSGGPAAGSLLQTIFALCLVLGLLACLAWFLKRYGPKAQAGSAHVRLVGALNLGGRERIMVVEVGEQWIVVGASPGRVNALATMARQPGAETGAVQAGATLHPHAPPAPSFAAWLKQTIDKRHAP